MLRPLMTIHLIGAFIGAWLHAGGHILAMTGGAAGTEVAELRIFYSAFVFLRFGPATAMAWILGSLLIGLAIQQLGVLARVEFRAAGAASGGALTQCRYCRPSAAARARESPSR